MDDIIQDIIKEVLSNVVNVNEYYADDVLKRKKYLEGYFYTQLRTKLIREVGYCSIRRGSINFILDKDTAKIIDIKFINLHYTQDREEPEFIKLLKKNYNRALRYKSIKEMESEAEINFILIKIENYDNKRGS